MVHYLNILKNPQIRYTTYLEVMKDFRKGGLTPNNYENVLEDIKNLPPINKRTLSDFKVFDKYNLTDVSEDDFEVILREVIKRAKNKAKKCWHPEAGLTTCDLDNRGKVKVTAAHSIQNNGVLSQIAENGHVMTYSIEKGTFEGNKKGKKLASIFWGFCNKHDAIFNPIETVPFSKTKEQNFLFAYRGFVVSSHTKNEGELMIDYGSQSAKDIEENKKLFDKAILSNDFDAIKTEIFELHAHYPIAVSSSFYLDFDFEGNPIPHSEDRMEDIFITLLPQPNKTYFLLSYLKEDSHLYGELGNQLRARNNFKSDITVLIAAHVENIYYNPIYYKTFIKNQKENLEKLMYLSQKDIGQVDNNNKIHNEISLTPNNYLNNKFNVNFFGY